MSVIIKSVERGSPAYKAGIKSGDNLVSIDGNEIMEMFNLKPSREVGQLKSCLKDAVLDNRVANEREALMQLLMEKAAQMGLASQA